MPWKSDCMNFQYNELSAWNELEELRMNICYTVECYFARI